MILPVSSGRCPAGPVGAGGGSARTPPAAHTSRRAGPGGPSRRAAAAPVTAPQPGCRQPARPGTPERQVTPGTQEAPPPWRGRGRGQRDLLQPRPVLRRGLPALRPGRPLRRGGQRRRRNRQGHQARPGHGVRYADRPAGIRGAAAAGHRVPGVRRDPGRHDGHRRRAQPFRSLDEIAAEANNTSYGLGAGIWTKDISKAHALAKKLRAGTVWINCYNVFDASLPFGGYKQSGWGREMGHEALEAYTEVKAVTTQL